MQRGPQRRVSLLLILTLLFAGGCSASDADDTTTTEATTTTPVTTTTTEATTTTTEAATTTTVGQDLELFCGAYLAFSSARDPESRVEPLNDLYAERGPDAPTDLNEVLKVLVSADYGSQDVRAEQAALREFVMPLCEDQYTAAVVGADSDEAAAQGFFDALVAGEKDIALTLASAQTVAMFEPWEPYDPEETELVVQDGSFWVALSPQFSFSCTTSEGIVTGCFFG